MTQALHDYFQRHEEQVFISKAFLTIFLIIFVKAHLGGLLSLLFILFPVIFLIYIRLKAASEGISPYKLLKRNITFIPIMYSEADRKREVIPWVTYCIILLNVPFFYLYDSAPRGDLRFMADNPLFLPVKPNAWRWASPGASSRCAWCWSTTPTTWRRC